MKKILSLITIFSMVLVLAGCRGGSSLKVEEIDGNKDLNMAIVTPSKEESEGDYLGAKQVVDDIALATKKDEIKNVTVKQVVLPTNFEEKRSQTRKILMKLANEKDLDAIVVSSKKAGLLKYMRVIKKKHPKLLLVAAPMGEPIEDISKVMTLGFERNYGPNGDDLTRLAKEFGATSFVALYSESDMNDRLKKQMRSIEEGCRKYGLPYFEISLSSSNRTNLKLEANKEINSIVKNRGSDTAIYGTSSAIDEAVAIDAIRYRYIVPGFYSDNTTDLYARLFKIDDITRKKMDYTVLNAEVFKVLKTYGLDFRVGGQYASYDVMLPQAATAVLRELVTKGLSYEKAYSPNFVEQSVEKRYMASAGYTIPDGLKNMKLVKIDQITY